jgi:hypothetical protein
MLNGELLKREDFLADAEYIKEVGGVRIGIFIGKSEPMENCNFHGNLIRATLLDHDITYAQVLSQVHRSTMPLKVTARLDILSTASLHLKLPDRTDRGVQGSAGTWHPPQGGHSVSAAILRLGPRLQFDMYSVRWRR